MIKLEEYFSDKINEFNNMENVEKKHLMHPISYLIKNPSRDIYYNTEFSFNVLDSKDNNYFETMKSCIEKEKNFSNINGYLGEIRCYGYILDAYTDDIIVTPIKTRKNSQTADFEIFNKKNNEKIYIEVNTKQCNDIASQKFKTARDNIKQKMLQDSLNNTHKISMYTSAIAPFGEGKNSYETNINVIQKIAQTKQGKRQIPEEEKGILWLDFQSEEIDRLLSLQHFKPLWYNKYYGMFSGLIWYGLYGKKGLPIFDSTFFDNAFKGYEKTHYMEHDGLFTQRKDISAVIFSYGTYTLYFENPFCDKKIPIWFLEKIINILKFNYENSIISFPNYNVKEEIINTYNKIKELSQIPNRSFS